MLESSGIEDHDGNTTLIHEREDTRVKWTPPLHQSFLSAISELQRTNQRMYISYVLLSHTNAFPNHWQAVSPSAILKIMNLRGQNTFNLSRIKVASHLQQYRSELKRLVKERKMRLSVAAGNSNHLINTMMFHVPPSTVGIILI